MNMVANNKAHMVLSRDESVIVSNGQQLRMTSALAFSEVRSFHYCLILH